MLTRANWVNDVGYGNVSGANLKRNPCARHDSRVLTSSCFGSRQSVGSNLPLARSLCFPCSVDVTRAGTMTKL